MTQTRIAVIEKAILTFDDGDAAEAIDKHLNHPEQALFERYITALATAIDEALDAPSETKKARPAEKPERAM